jgi:hypothetical protein
VEFIKQIYFKMIMRSTFYLITVTPGSVINKLDFISDKAPYFQKFSEEFPDFQNSFRSVVHTSSLNDAVALAQMGKLTGDKRYYDDTAKQFLGYATRMSVGTRALVSAA